jgi:tight adherence protein C
MVYAVAVFLIFFLLVATGLLLLFYREAFGRRLAGLLASRGETVAVERSAAAESLETVASYFGRLLPKSERESSVIQQRLRLAGFREERHLKMFQGSKFVVPVLLTAMLVVTKWYESNPFIIIAAALGIGYLSPDYWLGHRIKARQNTIRHALPDVLDILVVCLEAGLSLDQAVLRTSDEMRSVHPVLAEELGLVMLEVRGGISRLDAWKRLAERTDVHTVRMLVSILVQADQFGTGISKTLRIHADTLRTQRRQRTEELAAKTAVKLVFPLALFIFPSLFIVTLGPAIIKLAETFKELHK